MQSGNEPWPVKLFWAALPFAITAFVVFLALWKGFDTPHSSWIVIIPVIAIPLFPFFTVLSYAIRTSLRSRKLKNSKELYDSDTYLKHLITRGKRWIPVTILIWILVFLCFAVIPLGLVMRERIYKGSHLIIEGQPESLIPGSVNYKILSILDMTTQGLFFVSLLVLLLGTFTIVGYMIAVKKKSDKKMPKAWKRLGVVCIITFILPIILTPLLEIPIERITRLNVKAFLNGLSASAVVKIDGQIVKQPKLILSELIKFKPMLAHHSYAQHRFRVEIQDNNQGLVLFLGRDSSNPVEYWVFYPGFKYTYVNEIGRIRTNVFDDY